MFPFWIEFDVSTLVTAVPALLTAMWFALSSTGLRPS